MKFIVGAVGIRLQFVRYDVLCEAILFFIYRIARNFRGLKFSRMSLAQTFRDLIFEDCVRARDVG